MGEKKSAKILGSKMNPGTYLLLGSVDIAFAVLAVLGATASRLKRVAGFYHKPGLAPTVWLGTVVINMEQNKEVHKLRN